MRRSQFLKEMAGSFFQTVKSAYEPFLAEDLEKVEGTADRLLGITWVPIGKEQDLHEGLDMKYILGKPIIINRTGTNMQAMDSVCPVCSNIILLTTLYSSGKCLNCQKEYNFKTNRGDLQLISLPLKVKEGMYFIGFNRNQVNIHA